MQTIFSVTQKATLCPPDVKLQSLTVSPIHSPLSPQSPLPIAVVVTSRLTDCSLFRADLLPLPLKDAAKTRERRVQHFAVQKVHGCQMLSQFWFGPDQNYHYNALSPG